MYALYDGVINLNYDNMFEFEKTDGGYALTSYLKKDDQSIHKIEIPGQYKEKPVLCIGERAFEYSTSIVEVHIPPEVEVVDDNAFFCCDDLSSIRFSEGLRVIGNGAFSKCDDKLLSVTLPKSLERIGDWAFEGCYKLKSVTFLNPLTIIGENVFLNCYDLSTETKLIGVLRSCDLTQPIPESEYRQWERERIDGSIALMSYLILWEDVFKLAVKNKCFRSVAGREELVNLFEIIINLDWKDHLRIAADGGLLDDGELLDKLTDISVQKGDAELAAWLLEHKKNIGFSGNNYEL